MPIDRELLKCQRVGQGCRARRCSTDPARRAEYARRRNARLARLLTS